MAALKVSMPDQMRAWAESRVELGLYASTDAYIQDLIAQDRATPSVEKDWLAELDKGMRESDEDIAQGRLYDLDESCDGLIEMYREMEKGRDAA